MEFAKQKAERLNHADLSRKGSVDSNIQDVVNLINSLPMYFTTSSCAGRIILVENLEGKLHKKDCRWLHVTHDLVQMENIENALQDVTGEAIFKFEAMVMHVQCQTLEVARKMHQAAVAAGFRNSGITIGSKGKIITAVRSTHSLEAPLSSGGRLLVSQEYLKYLAASANSKMEENLARIIRFHENMKVLVEELMLPHPAEVECLKKQKKPPKHLGNNQYIAVSCHTYANQLAETSCNSESDISCRMSGTEIQTSKGDDDSDFSLFMFEDS